MVRQRTYLALWAFERWWHTMYMLRGFDLFGQRILPIILAIRDTAAFIIVLCFVIGGAVHAFYAIGTSYKTGVFPSPFYAAFLHVYRLAVLNDFDLWELEGQDTLFFRNDDGKLEPEEPEMSSLYWPVHMVFYAVTFVIGLFLMNILIGILGSNYER